MKHRTLTLTLLPLALGISPHAPAATVFVNELHYDNAGADVDEMVEVAGTAGTDLGGWTVVFYNGSSGEDYQTLALGGVIPEQSEGLGVLSFPVSGVQNGAPDGLALVSGLGAIEQFLSYEGVLTATAGPAAGLTSTDIGVAELGTEDPGLSLQLTGAGREAADFVWSGPAAASPGQINAAQTVAPVAPVPLPPALLGLLGALGVLCSRRALGQRLSRRAGDSGARTALGL